MSMIAVSVLKNKIKETEEQLAGFEKLLPSEIASFQMSELQRRLDSLNDELKGMEEAQARELITLRLYGENIEPGKISNRVLVSVLNGFQTLVDDIANVLVGENTTRGQLNAFVKEIANFEVCGTFAGSFGIKLEKNYRQTEILNKTLKANALLEEFFSILENSSDEEKLIEKISPYGQRTVKCYQEWLKQMENEAINIELNWINEISERRQIKMQYSSSKDIIHALDSIKDLKNEDVVIRAVLTGINIRKNTFELKAEEDVIIKGKSRLETLIKAADKIGSEVQAKLVKSIMFSSIYDKKETWFLADLISED